MLYFTVITEREVLIEEKKLIFLMTGFTVFDVDLCLFPPRRSILSHILL